ncbi:hypothetical protein HK096_002376 [Nowakowskiella sp. JEL0078]|nr:hypothetical protein HK096_002376 [Nowakowskiella sp. JEL0078]
MDIMLERDRVTTIPDHERNFHIFYQLIAGLSNDEKLTLKIQDTSTFSFLNNVKQSKLVQFKDSTKFLNLRSCMSSIGILKKEQQVMFEFLSGILHLGNIEFIPDIKQKEGPAMVKNVESLQIAAEFLGVDALELENCLVQHSILIGDTMCTDFLDPLKAATARNVFAQSLYEMLFTWLIDRLNYSLSANLFATTIGILDLCGMEDKQRGANLYEQFCINYACERLQALMITSMITATETSFKAENIPYEALGCTINNALLQMYEAPETGLFSIIDSQTIKPDNLANEATILDLVLKTHERNPAFGGYRPGWKSFGILHYTGKIKYEVADFIHKNKSSVSADFLKLASQSKKDLLKSLALNSNLKTKRHPKSHIIVGGNSSTRNAEFQRKNTRRNTVIELKGNEANSMTINTQLSLDENNETRLTGFKRTLDSLISTISLMRPWYVLCLKTNVENKPDQINDTKLISQIRAMKIVDLKKATKNDYTTAIMPLDYLKKYGAEGDQVFDDLCAPGNEIAKKSMFEQIFMFNNWTQNNAVLGSSRIFLTEKTWRSLESNFDKTRPSSSRLIHIPTKPYKNPIIPTPKIEETKISINSKNKVGVDFSDLFADKTPLEELLPEKKEETLESKIKVTKQEKSPPPKPVSNERRMWLGITWGLTWWIPTYCLIRFGKMQRPDVQMCWREKVALCIIIFFMSAFMIFFVQFLSRIMCPPQNYYTVKEIATHTGTSSDAYVSWNGYVYNVYYYENEHPQPGLSLLQVVGGDASAWFPRVDPVTHAIWEKCYVSSNLKKRDVNTSSSSSVTSTVSSKITTSTSSTATATATASCQNAKIVAAVQKSANVTLATYCHKTWVIDMSINLYNDIPIYLVGSVAYDLTDVQKHATTSDAWVVLNGRIYDVSPILSGVVDNFLGTDNFNYINYYKGNDASKVYSKLQSYIPCFEKMFFVGVIDTRSTVACNIANYILICTTGVMVFVLCIKFLAALQLGSKRYPEDLDRFVILQVPCYTEGEDSLRKTIDSLALLKYDDTRKLLFLIADGMIKGAGNELPTPEIVLKILGVEPQEAVDACSYVAIGEGSKRHNKGKVYSGLYSIHSRQIPFIVVVKVGKESETSRPGNRGKRDSQMIIMKFLNKVHFDSPMTPLDLEIYRHIKEIIGVDPFLYEYTLMVDADTEVEPDSLNRLIACMVNDSKIMGISGETKIANQKTSWVTMMQVYEYFISHHMAKAFESLFGNVTCLPGCFCMFVSHKNFYKNDTALN